ncbi:MAG: hypothetical protein U9Q81_05060 [Pseudomonadota bacterium]|nr:hypothetical protein [Pseudomonadota bacterium]
MAKVNVTPPQSFRVTAYYPNYPGLDPYEDAPHEVTVVIESSGEAQAALDAVVNGLIPIMYLDYGGDQAEEERDDALEGLKNLDAGINLDAFRALIVASKSSKSSGAEPVFWRPGMFHEGTKEDGYREQRWPEILELHGSGITIGFGDDNDAHTLDPKSVPNAG